MEKQPLLVHPGGAEESGILTCDNLSSGARNVADDAGIVPVPRTPRSSPSYVDLIANLNHTKKLLICRSHSAPSLFSSNKESVLDNPGHAPKFTFCIVGLPLIYVLVYFAFGIAIFMTTGSFERQETKVKTVSFIDAMYFTMVTLCTTGYGDIIPTTTFTKLFTCALVLAGCWLLGTLLNGLVPYIIDRLEAVMLRAGDENSRFDAMVGPYMVDKEKGRLRIRIKVCLAVGAVFAGTVMAHCLEDFSWVDSFYLSVISMTTVGYGDCKFSTAAGRGLAVVWLLFSTLAVADAFLYLIKLIDQRNRLIENWALRQKMTLGDLVTADLDKDGCVRRSEFIIYKLKQMGKITQRDIAPISNRFNVLDTRRFGKITLSDLMESE